MSLPIMKILELADYYSIEDTERFIYSMQEMDSEFVKEMGRVARSQQKQKTKVK